MNLVNMSLTLDPTHRFAFRPRYPHDHLAVPTIMGAGSVRSGAHGAMPAGFAPCASSEDEGPPQRAADVIVATFGWTTRLLHLPEPGPALGAMVRRNNHSAKAQLD